jgi:hypothetical protein
LAAACSINLNIISTSSGEPMAEAISSMDSSSIKASLSYWVIGLLSHCLIKSSRLKAQRKTKPPDWPATGAAKRTMEEDITSPGSTIFCGASIFQSGVPNPLTGREGALPRAPYEMIFTPLEIMSRLRGRSHFGAAKARSVWSRSTVLTAGISNGGSTSVLGASIFQSTF